MSDIRTVMDMIGDDWLASEILDALGVDPDMPFEDFARWLRYGKNADGFTEDTPPDIQSEFAKGWFDGGNFVIRAIKADPWILLGWTGALVVGHHRPRLDDVIKADR